MSRFHTGYANRVPVPRVVVRHRVRLCCSQVTHPEDERKDAKRLHTLPASKCNMAYWKDRLVVISRSVHLCVTFEVGQLVARAARSINL